ncbi:nucleotide-binding protein [Halorubrum cibi]|uniref:Septum site-determining protein MinD n=1 Tax=Halorubrum cibi TaxID=413815 RepID=A0A521ASK6_9EURY|nr:P-loop NTPase [Halorubrum cibi]SMO37741.1 septum site-determining protein MinD [Halorubrum cibi]
MATVYAVASAKGGVGKTTTTAAIATLLAESGADVVAIDADVGMANLADALGMVPGETTIHDVLAGRADPAEAVHDGPAGLRVVPGDPDLDAYAAADPAELAGVVEAFSDADYVFLDAGAGLSHDSTLPIGLADETLLVSTPDRSALGDTEKTRQLAERIGGHVAGAAITRVGGDEDESVGLDDASGMADPDDPAVDIVDEILATEVLARIPEDPAVARASTAGEPLTTFDPNALASRAYRELVRTLAGVDVAGPEGRAESGAEAEPEIEAEPETEAESEADRKTESEADSGGRSDAEVERKADEDTDSDDADDDIIVAESETLVEDAEVTASDADDADAVTGEADETHDSDDTDDTDDTREAAEDEDSTGLIDEAEPTADEESGDLDRSRSDDSDGDDGDTDDDDDEDDLAGSVPFRDDDSGTMATALTGSDDDARDSNDGTGEGETEGDSDDEDEGNGGFFGRLLGR